MRIVIVSDAWFPQVNGVVRTLGTLKQGLETLGHDVVVIHPGQFRTIPCPTYPEIRLALFSRAPMARRLADAAPDAIHIATEGPLGNAARDYCVSHGLGFTTAYHTRFPEYVHARWCVPLNWTYASLRRFHAPSGAVMVPTASVRTALEERGFQNIRHWTRGVDTVMFRPRKKGFLDWPRPILLYVGRVAVEKNIDAFLALDLPGSKVVVGDGPQLASLQRRFPVVQFVGAKHGKELARYYAAADVFVFPSRTDTFGLVVLEALASGVPVAAYPVPGPLDIIGGTEAGALDENLGRAVSRALELPAAECRALAMTYAWEVSVQQFLSHLRPQCA